MKTIASTFALALLLGLGFGGSAASSDTALGLTTNTSQGSRCISCWLD